MLQIYENSYNFWVSLWPKAKRVHDLSFLGGLTKEEEQRLGLGLPLLAEKRTEATIVFASLRQRHHAADPHLQDDHTFRYRNRKYETSNKTPI